MGLVSDRKSDRKITKIALEDPTGSMEIVVFEGDFERYCRYLTHGPICNV